MRLFWTWQAACWLVIILALGCGSTCPETRCGWRFEVLKPGAVVSAPTVTAVTSNQPIPVLNHVDTVGSVSVPAPRFTPRMSLAATPAEAAAVPPHAAMAGPMFGTDMRPDPCSIEELCRRIEQLERERARMGNPRLKSVPAPMPNAPEQ